MRGLCQRDTGLKEHCLSESRKRHAHSPSNPRRLYTQLTNKCSTGALLMVKACNELIVQSAHLTLRKRSQIWTLANSNFGAHSVPFPCFFSQTLLRCVCAVFEACWHSLPWCSWHPRSITGRSTWKHLKGKPRGRRSSRLSSLLDTGWPSTASSQRSSFILCLSTENHGDFQMPCVLIQFSSGYHNIDMVI